MALPANPLGSLLPGAGTSAGVNLATEVMSGTLLAGTNIASGAISASNIANNTISSSQLATNLLQLTSVINITSTNLLNMYTTPVTVLAAVTGYTIVVNKAILRFTPTSTHYANGGVVGLVYGTSGNACTGTVAASVITASSAAEGVLAGVSVVSAKGETIQITNATGAFITGTGTATLQIWYSLI